MSDLRSPAGPPPHRGPAVATDFWFAQIDHRLSRIEAMVERIERQVANIVYVGIAVLATEALRVLILA